MPDFFVGFCFFSEIKNDKVKVDRQIEKWRGIESDSQKNRLFISIAPHSKKRHAEHSRPNDRVAQSARFVSQSQNLSQNNVSRETIDLI